MGKYTEVEKLHHQVFNARNRILGAEHPHTIIAMENLAATLRHLGKYMEAKKLVIQAEEVKGRVPGPSHKVATSQNSLNPYLSVDSLGYG